MTQHPAPPPARGAVRSAVEALLRTCVDLERGTEAVAGQSRARTRRVSGELAGLRRPTADVAALTGRLDALGRQLEADLRGRLAELRQAYVTEIHALLSLLAPLHGLAPLPPLPPAPAGAGLSDHFPAGFARAYVDDLVAGVDRSVTLTVAEASAAPVQRQTASDQTKSRIGDRLISDDRHEGMRMLQDSECHAVERHGPHITIAAQLARLLWRKDPTGTEYWQPLPHGGAESDHWCGPAAGGFTSPEAMAKPLQALLSRARDHRYGLNELLTRNTKSKTKRISIHVSAASAGLVAGDAVGYRGTGTSDRGMTDDWLDARDHAMIHGAPPVYAVQYDPIAEGADPGAFLMFKRTGTESWTLVTCYPVGHRNPNCKRMEDLT